MSESESERESDNLLRENTTQAHAKINVAKKND